MNNSIFIISVVVMVLLLTFGIETAPRKQFHKDFFSVQISKGLQGFLGICTILHLSSIALYDYEGDRSLYHLYYYCGVLIVGYFFFCSGYGLLHSLNTKKDYLHGFVKKRIILILVPFFLCNYIYLIFSQLMGVTYSASNLIAAFFGFLLSNKDMWFAVEIMILYLLFYIIFSKVKKQGKAILILGILVFILISVSLFMGRDYKTVSQGLWFRGEWWFNTTSLFIFGMLFARYEKKIVSWLQHLYVWKFTFSLIGFVFFYCVDEWIISFDPYGYDPDGHFPGMQLYIASGITLLIQTILVLFFIQTLLLVMMKIKFQNRVLSFLGEFSLEILLINYFFASMFRSLLEINVGFYVAAVTASSIAASIVINKIKKIVLDLDNRKKKGSIL